MSTFIQMRSACGATVTAVDIVDAPLNPFGVVCCSDCESIIAARESWIEEYNA
jgi:hypothetical protein